MQYYETMMVLTTRIDEEQTNAVVEKFNKLISDNGTIISTDIWGKRRLAYEIDHQTEGYYVLTTFQSETDFTAELDRIYNITDSVLRSIIIKLEELPAKSATKPVEATPASDDAAPAETVEE